MQSLHSERIGLVTWDYQDPKGGLGYALQDIVSTLRETGATIEVFAPSEGYLRFTRMFGGHVLFSLLLPFVLHRWLRKNDCATLMLPVGPGGVFLFRKPAMRTIAIVYHTYVDQSRYVPGERWKSIIVPFERRTLRNADRIFCYSADTARTLQVEYRCGEKVKQLPQILRGTPANFEQNIKTPRTCICIARLEPRKGVLFLLEAWKEVLKIMPDATLTIIGKGVQAARVEQNIQQLRGVVRMIPSLPRETLLQELSKAEVFACPSYLEGFGLAIAEAMHVGTAVVAQDVPGVRNLLEDGITGFLSEEGNTHAFAASILCLMYDPDIRKTFTENAFNAITHQFSTENAQRALVEAVFAD